ncbi:MAG TPA: serine/threonine-protein kinase [Polyangia bacterium]|nr:serine/threonine-protein kinase [Polyangia bacterium]
MFSLRPPAGASSAASAPGATEPDPNERTHPDSLSPAHLDAHIARRDPPAVGDIIGDRYRLLAVLGGGAMGQVFVAENLTIGLRVAIKVLRPEMLQSQVFRQRFQHEAQAIAAIEHPNVARFYDLVMGDPTFLVMEYVRGFTLSEVLKAEQRLETGRAVAIGIRLCWGLEAAHAAGVIHRDLKPANIIMTTDPELGETPKLIDFGLAKLAAATEAEQLTRTGQIIGTPHYMSPEQIAGKPIDTRSDIYAVGCLVYQMLAGRTPFVGASDDVDVLYRQVHEPPDPPSRHSPAVPPALDAILLRALAKDPKQRFGSMAEMARALATAVPVSLRHSSGFSASLASAQAPASDSGSLVRSMLVGAAVGALLLGVVGAGIAVRRRSLAGGAGGASLLLLASQPAGASVEIDGQPLSETTPTAVRGLAPGMHQVRIRGSGRAAVERPVTLTAGERTLVEITLPLASRTIEVQTAPGGAKVYLDGRLASGETPTTVSLSQDDFHELRVEKLGYLTLVKALSPDDRADRLLLTLEPEKIARGTIMVESNQPAEVWIDGVDTGFVTPTIGLHVAAREHTIELRDPDGARAAVRRVRVRRGETLRVVLVPGPRKSP